MTKNKKKYAIIFLICSMLLSIIFSTATTALGEPVWSGLEGIQSEYNIGFELSVPSVTATLGSNTKTADVVIKKPDGVEVTQGKVLLDKMGYYTILSTVEFSETVYTNSLEFYTGVQSFTYTGTGSSFRQESITYYPQGVETHNANGVIAELSEGSRLTYSEIVDLNSLGENASIINAVIIPEVGGVPDFKAFEFRLTDAHNPDNFIVVRVDYQATSVAYYKTRTSNRERLVGTGTGTPAYLAYGEGGQLNFMNFDGGSTGTSQKQIKFYYSNKTIYMSNEGTKKAILDFKDLEIYSRSGLWAEFVEWDGFTTGEVYVSLEASNFEGSNPARFFITEIGGEAVSANIIRDSQPPKLTIDLGDNNENEIFGVLNEEFTLFNASVSDDISEDLTIDIKVFKKYGLSEQTKVNISDFKFTPDELGLYTIEYSVSDWSRNTTVETITVNVNRYGDEDISVNATLSQTGISKIYLQGQYFELPSATITAGQSSESAHVVLYLPDGRAAESDLYLNMTGQYKLEYNALINDKQYRMEERFFVAATTYQTSNSDDSVYKDVLDIYPNGTFTENANGVMAELSEYGRLTYNKIINLNALGGNTSIINALIIPEVGGTPDFKAFEFRLTDAHNSDNFIVVRVDYQASSTAYYKTRTSNRERLVGTGDTGYLAYGAGGQLNFMNFDGGSTGTSQKQIKFYYSDKTIYMSNEGTKKAILDFKDLEIYSRSGLAAEFAAWNGFTNGEVYVSLQALNLQGDNPARFFITEIGGEAITSETQLMYTSDEQPQLLLEHNRLKGYINNIIDLESLVLKAEARYGNYYYDLSPEIAIYKLTNNGEEELNSTAKEFSSAAAGVFRVEYAITDYFDNISEKSIYLSIFDALSENDIVLSKVMLQKQYAKDYNLAIPTATISVLDNSIDALAVLYFPDGNAYVYNNAVLSQIGTYNLQYRVTLDGKVYKVNNYFEVFGSVFQSTESKNVIEYGSSPHAEQPGSGMMANFTPSSTLYYNKIIDLSEFDLTTPALEFSIVPHELLSPDFEKLAITFTDIYNPSNFVTIGATGILDRNYNAGIAYWYAGSATQPQTGYEAWSNVIHRGDGYGAPVVTNFGHSSTYHKIQVFFDYASRSIYIGNGTGVSTFVIDLDDSYYFYETWNGFTDGKVLMSVSLDAFKSSNTGRILFRSIGGENMASADNTFYDTTPPEITVNFGNYSQNTIPEGAKNIAYSIFEATAYDSYNGTITPNIKVFYNYGEFNQTNVIFTDGKFMPSRAGVYTIEYSAKDWSGNIATETVNVVINDEYRQIEFNLITAGEETSKIGTNTAISTFSLTGGFGNINLTVEAFLDGAESIKITDDYFKPLKSGTYTIKYTAVDYLGQSAEYEYELVVSVNLEPVFDSEAELPKYLVAGSWYDLPNLTAYDYSSGTSKTVSSAIWIEDDLGRRQITGNRYQASAAESGDAITIEYIATNSNASTTKAYTIKVIDVEYGDALNLKKYFVVDGNIDIGATSKYVSFNAKSNNSSFEFINPVLAQSFLLHFSIDSASNNTDTINIYLTDFANRANTVKISVNKASLGSTFCINNGTEYALTQSFGGSEEFILSLDKTMKTLNVNGISATIEKNILNQLFNGFESGKIYIEVEFENLSSPTTLRLSRINNQPFSNIDVDRVRPEIIYIGDYGGHHPINTAYLIKGIKALDVLDPDLKATLTVTVPGGDYAMSTDGVILNGVSAYRDYLVNLNKYGSYVVDYKADVPTMWDESFTFIITVWDSVAPVITLSTENTQISAKKGDTIILPQATATDNASLPAKITILRYLTNTKGSMSKITGTSFVADEEGTYVVQYLAIDEAGNQSVVEYIIIIGG